jgi:hypothetical protein
LKRFSHCISFEKQSEFEIGHDFHSFLNLAASFSLRAALNWHEIQNGFAFGDIFIEKGILDFCKMVKN